MGALCLFEFSVVDEPHGERAAGHRVPERVGERQRRAALEHLGHRHAVGQPVIVDRAGGFERNPRLAEELAVAPEASSAR